MSFKRLAPLFYILFSCNASLAQNTARADAPHFAPPWVAQSDNFLMVAFNLGASPIVVGDFKL